jgi:methionyl-tRNA formyltransferase
MNIVLCALPGFGNTVLDALLADRSVSVQGVFTRRYSDPFPYYDETQLAEVCELRSIPWRDSTTLSGEYGLKLLRKASPDLILVATFNEILRPPVLSLPRLGVVNLHPSLLPKYRGPCPTHAALLNGDDVTGVTVHYVTDRLDAGDVLLQRPLPIDKADNDGRLRQRLARLAGDLVPEIISMFEGGRKPAGSPQNDELATRAPRPAREGGWLTLDDDIELIRRRIRAFNPLPGTSISVGDRRVSVRSFAALENGKVPGVYETDHTIDIVRASGAIRLFKAEV